MVSTEVEPAVFDEADLDQVGARVVHHVHKGWFSAECDARRLGDLRHLRGVVSMLVVGACDDRLDQVPADTQWRELAAADGHGLLTFHLEAGAAGGRVIVLRLRAEVRQSCFVRSHKTSGMDIVVRRPGAAAPVARHSDGLRDLSEAGMHNWKVGEQRQIAMWVGHLPAGRYAVEAGLVDGWIRVGGPLLPFTFGAEVDLGQG